MMRLFELAYLMLPAYVANMAPPFVKYWHGWNRPISRRWLGEHKTVVGFGLGVMLGVLTAYVQSRTYWLENIASRSAWLAVGFAQGFGAMAGDAIKSLFKRVRGIAPGQPWIPADQLDFVAGALALLWPLVQLDAFDAILILAITFAGDIVANHISFRLGIRDTKW